VETEKLVFAKYIQTQIFYCKTIPFHTVSLHVSVKMATIGRRLYK